MKVANGKLRCADHIVLRRKPAWRPVGDGYGFSVFRLIFFYCLCSSYADISSYAPLDGPISYARPKSPPPTHNTRTRSPFIQLTAVNHYLSRPFHRVASIVLYTAVLRILVVWYSNSLWITVCDFRVEKPIFVSLLPYIISLFGLALSYLTLFSCFLSLVLSPLSRSDIAAFQLLH